jgi:hypothetical protein
VRRAPACGPASADDDLAAEPRAARVVLRLDAELVLRDLGAAVARVREALGE